MKVAHRLHYFNFYARLKIVVNKVAPLTPGYALNRNSKLTIAVKRVAGGKGSNFINDNFKPGVEIEVMEPMGNFHPALDEKNAKHYILFGGGSGIKPVMAILKSVLNK